MEKHTAGFVVNSVEDVQVEKVIIFVLIGNQARENIVSGSICNI